MSHKFQNKYRISSTRLQNWDYRWNAPYFITICTENKEHYFGEIVNGKMILSNQGILADVFWYEIKTHATHVELDEFTVMPNHIHGILILNNPNDGTNVETRHALSLPQTPTPPHPPIPQPVPTQNPRATTISKPGQKFIIIHCWFVQISGNQTCQSLATVFWLAIPFLRKYHPRCGSPRTDQKLHSQQSLQMEGR